MKWPHWLPKSSLINVKLTPEQRNYILPVFNLVGGHSLDGVSLCENCLIGNRIALLEIAKRFRYSDLSMDNFAFLRIAKSVDVQPCKPNDQAQLRREVE